MKIREMFLEDGFNIARISKKTGLGHSVVRDRLDMTDSLIDAQETHINIYSVLGYDGDDPENVCARCEIILIKDGATIPAKWGEHQNQVGNVCQQCSDTLWAEYPLEHGFLSTCSCMYCPLEAEIYYYKQSRRAVQPSLSVPLCTDHKEVAYGEVFSDHIRDFHDSLPGEIILELHRSC